MDDSLIAAAISFYPFPLFRQIAYRIGIPISMYCWGDILEIAQTSTTTILGRFTDVKINEQDDIGRFRAGGNLVLVGSLFGENFLPGYDPTPKDDAKAVKRGRKPKTKERKRKPKGNNRYFNSQISFHVKSEVIKDKIYKVKVYRNGVFQIPGVLYPDYSDMHAPLEVVRQALEAAYPGLNIRAVDHQVQMYNCKSILVDPSLFILTRRFGECVNKTIARDNPLKIFKCGFVDDKSSAKTTIKFSRPSEKKSDKKITLKVLQQKINWEGCTGKDQVEPIFTWLNEFLIANFEQIVYDPLREEIKSLSEVRAQVQRALPAPAHASMPALDGKYTTGAVQVDAAIDEREPDITDFTY